MQSRNWRWGEALRWGRPILPGLHLTTSHLTSLLLLIWLLIFQMMWPSHSQLWLHIRITCKAFNLKNFFPIKYSIHIHWYELGRHGSPLQCSCSRDPMDRGAYRLRTTGSKESGTAEQLSMHTQSGTSKRTHFYFCSFYRGTLFIIKHFQIHKSRVNNVISFYVSITQLPQLSVFYQSCIINSLWSVFKSTFSSTSGNAKHNHLLLSCWKKN